MTSEQAKNLCLQAIWKHRVRVLFPSGEWFILANIPLQHGGLKRVRATYQCEDEEVRVEVEATGHNAQNMLIECMERAILESTG